MVAITPHATRILPTMGINMIAIGATNEAIIVLLFIIIFLSDN
ncbi:hypothetical protein ASZ90_007297 [hydrocarbon metagenome]|uniref:Uncharacterized protein n=1 Tax=hydrocarbon metagenome TaxID=938273 RepID=A0A0W8FQ46_9ZZZZ